MNGLHQPIQTKIHGNHLGLALPTSPLLTLNNRKSMNNLSTYCENQSLTCGFDPPFHYLTPSRLTAPLYILLFICQACLNVSVRLNWRTNFRCNLFKVSALLWWEPFYSVTTWRCIVENNGKLSPTLYYQICKTRPLLSDHNLILCRWQSFK